MNHNNPTTSKRQAELADWLIVIPARLASQRLPRKPLQDLGGKPLIVQVYENLAPLAQLGASLLVATDADEIMRVCEQHSLNRIMTSPSHPSGTDRCYEAALSTRHPYIMNVQGDEPFIWPQDLINLAHALERSSAIDMATLVFEASDPALAADPNVVKAIRSQQGLALYFSRSPIPYDREAKAARHLPTRFWQHLGTYAFRRQALQKFCELAPTSLEQTEKLEQLRALEHDWRIYLQPAQSCSRGIDTIEDLEAARALLYERSKK